MNKSGVLLLDKPAGWSSNQALGRAKRLIGERKAGHTGTLDPFATGLLPICFGEATKFSADLLDADKTYLATARLGFTSTTGDIEGEIKFGGKVDVDSALLDATLSQFRGSITQVPPMHSALKREGRPLYELARAGIEVERAARSATIQALDLVSFDGELLTFRVTCSKGTYVRVLAEDIGRALGCGAYLTALRRERVAALAIEHATTLEALEAASPPAREAMLLPLDALIQAAPRVELDQSLAARFSQGQRLVVPPLTSDATQPLRVRVYEGNNLLGTALLESSGRLQPQRLISKELR